MSTRQGGGSERPSPRYRREHLTDANAPCPRCRTPLLAILCVDTREGGRLLFFACPYCDCWPRPKEGNP
jgi:hypothetical protein